VRGEQDGRICRLTRPPIFWCGECRFSPALATRSVGPLSVDIWGWTSLFRWRLDLSATKSGGETGASRPRGAGRCRLGVGAGRCHARPQGVAAGLQGASGSRVGCGCRSVTAGRSWAHAATEGRPRWRQNGPAFFAHNGSACGGGTPRKKSVRAGRSRTVQIRPRPCSRAGRNRPPRRQLASDRFPHEGCDAAHAKWTSLFRLWRLRAAAGRSDFAASALAAGRTCSFRGVLGGAGQGGSESGASAPGSSRTFAIRASPCLGKFCAASRTARFDR
jgi:hypothetical protein